LTCRFIEPGVADELQLPSVRAGPAVPDAALGAGVGEEGHLVCFLSDVLDQFDAAGRLTEF
jgi:hypothetical protein